MTQAAILKLAGSELFLVEQDPAYEHQYAEMVLSLVLSSETTLAQQRVIDVTQAAISRLAGSEQSPAEQDPVYEQRYVEMVLSLASSSETTLA